MTPLTLLPQDAHVSLHFILASVAFVSSSLSSQLISLVGIAITFPCPYIPKSSMICNTSMINDDLNFNSTAMFCKGRNIRLSTLLFCLLYLRLQAIRWNDDAKLPVFSGRPTPPSPPLHSYATISSRMQRNASIDRLDLFNRS